MKHSESIAKLAAALVAAQAELEAVGMDAINPHFKAKYASLDNIIGSIRPTLAKHRLAVVQGATLPESDSAGKVTGFTVETMLVHESGEWLSSGVVMPLAKADPQGAGAAITYGRRYGLSALLSLATDEDDDGNQASQRRGTGGAHSAPRSAEPTSGRGEVSGSIGSGPKSPTTTTHALPGADFVMPFGKSRGKPVGTLDSETLSSVAEWVNEKQFQKKHADLLIAIATVLKSREAA